jgi:tetratricopeptide (TPR) repeat protein
MAEKKTRTKVGLHSQAFGVNQVEKTVEVTPQKAPHLIACSLISLLVLVLYTNTLGNSFAFDDGHMVVKNQLIRSLSNIPKIFFVHYWYSDSAEKFSGYPLYRPMVILTYALNYAIHKLDPMGYHLVNLALHLITSNLVYLLVFLTARHFLLAAVVGLLFAAHPIHTEAIANVVGRADILASAFMLSAWALYIVHGEATGKKRHVYYLLSMVSFFLALLSKEPAIALLGILPIYEAAQLLQNNPQGIQVRLQRYWQQLHRHGFWGYLVVAGVYWGLRYNAVHVLPTPASDLTGETPFDRVLLSLRVLGKYFELTAFPLRLSADYSPRQIPTPTSLAEWDVLIAILVIGVLLWIAIRSIKSVPWLSFSVLLFFLTLFPAVNVFYIVMGERLLYLPSLGFCWGVGVVLVAQWERLHGRWSQRVIAGAVLVVLVLYGYRTITRNWDWKDQFTIFQHTVQASPQSAKARFNFALALADRGDTDEAIREHWEAIRILPHYESYYYIGNLYMQKGWIAQAVEVFKAAIQTDPSRSAARVSLGHVFSQHGQGEEAIVQLNEALRLDPESPSIYRALGDVSFKLGRIDDAINAYLQVLERKPQWEEIHVQLGNAYFRKGMLDHAIEQYKEALQLNADRIETHNNLAAAYAQKGLLDHAIAEYQAALQINPNLAVTHYNLGNVYLRKQQRQRAVFYYREAIRLDPNLTVARSALERMK